MKKRVMAFFTVAVMCATLFAGCGKTEQKQETKDTIKIGFMGPLTGELAQYGIAVQNGIKMYTEEINAKGGIDGKKVELISYDEKGDSVEAISAFNRLVNQDKVVAIFGDVTSAPTIAIAQESAKMENPIPVITASGTAAEITSYGDNMFRSCFLDPFQGEKMASYAGEILKAKSAAIIYNKGSDYSVGLEKAFEETCKKMGIDVVAKESYAEGDVDFRAQLNNISSKNPEVIFCPDYYQSVTLIASQAREIGIDKPMLGCDGWDGVLGVTNDVSVLHDIYFSNHYSVKDPSEIIQNFLKNYTEQFKMEPSAFAATAYDAAKIMYTAIDTADSTESKAIIEDMKKNEVEGVTGKIVFDENNNPKKSCAIITVKDGEYQLDRKY